ncbi:MAG: ParB/RepB/Spo0J family partition protein [Trueperaceae bacterium]|nr:MAG: ParB/RepB/Spo0J family partition protein [Trueperaceae bacterium]
MPTKPRGLGRGLDALLPKVDKGIQHIPISRLDLSPFQPRKRVSEVGLLELATSVASKGILQPLVVRERGERFEIVAGERRFRAARQAGLAVVPAIVKDLSDQETLEIAIIENLQREDLSAVDEARAFKLLMDFGLNQDGVAKAVGKSRSAVANSLRLLTLSDRALEALEEGKITAGHARAILAQPDEDREWALKQITTRGLSVREAEALNRERIKKRSAESDGRYEQLEEDLARHTGTKVKISGGRRGRIELYFHSVDELERLLELIGYQA